MNQRICDLFYYAGGKLFWSVKRGAAKYLGTFDSADLAQAAYAAAATQHFKEFARV